MAVLPVLQPVVWTLTPAAAVGRAVNAATQRLEEAGIDPARLDAQVILAHVLGVNRSWLYAHYDYELEPEQSACFTELIARRIQREPVAYLIGRKEFYGLELAVDRRVLIPRPETEMLVDAVLEIAAGKSPAPIKIADVGTGSGAIALAVANNAPNAQVYALDVSHQALEVAHVNVQRHDPTQQVVLVHSDLLARLPTCVDVIVANLPYVTSSDYATLHEDVRNYEPQLALEAGDAGLDVISRLLHQLPHVLEPGGAVILEIGYNQGALVLDLVRKALPGAYALDLQQDYQGHDRMVSFCL